MKSALYFFFFLTLNVITLTSHAFAKQSEFAVAAVVNDHAITRYDVNQRIRFIIATTGIDPTEKTINNLFPRVMNTLIDEQLQRQEAARYNIFATPEEIAEAITRIEKESKKAEGSMTEFLKKAQIDKNTLDTQLSSQIIWAKLMQKRVLPKITVSDQDISRAVEQNMQTDRSVDEVKIASLVLPISATDDADKTEKLAKQITSDLRAGASFKAIAHQLSAPQLATISPTWVAIAQLDPQVAETIRALTPPAITDPVRISAGYQILLLQDRRSVNYETNADVMFKEIILTLPVTAKKNEVDLLMTIARDVRKNAGSCTTKNIAGAEDLEDLKFEVDYTNTTFAEVSPQILPLVRGLAVGETSEPFATPEGIRLLQLCEKTVLPVKAPDKERVERKLKEEKFTLEALRVMRDLRRDAYIDIRL
jgi:peptidyl-prolyl cis-trans isomerase SurA